MEYINIISQEPITTIANWWVYTVSGIVVAAILGLAIYYAITIKKDASKFNKFFCNALCIGIVIIIFEMVALSIGSVLFRVPTGKYKYGATINKDKITVSQYEEFIEKYSPTIQDSVYYWED